MFEKGAEHPAIDIGAHARLLDERTRGTADALRIADRVQPRSSRQHGACPTQLREEATTTRRSHGASPRADREPIARVVIGAKVDVIGAVRSGHRGHCESPNPLRQGRRDKKRNSLSGTSRGPSGLPGRWLPILYSRCSVTTKSTELKAVMSCPRVVWNTRPLPKESVISMGSSRPVPLFSGSENAVASTVILRPGPLSRA